MELVHYNYDNFQRVSNIKSTMNYIYMTFEVSFTLKLVLKKKKKRFRRHFNYLKIKLIDLWKLDIKICEID